MAFLLVRILPAGAPAGATTTACETEGWARVAQLLQKTSTPPSPSPAQRYRPPGCTSRYAKSRSSRTPRTSTGGPCLGARGKQAQLAQANGSKFNLLLMLVAQMSTHPRAIATHYCSWGSTKFKPTHGAPTAFEDLGVQTTALKSRPRRRSAASSRRVGS